MKVFSTLVVKEHPFFLGNKFGKLCSVLPPFKLASSIVTYHRCGILFCDTFAEWNSGNTENSNLLAASLLEGKSGKIPELIILNLLSLMAWHLQASDVSYSWGSKSFMIIAANLHVRFEF